MDRLKSEDLEAWRPYDYKFDIAPIGHDLSDMSVSLRYREVSTASIKSQEEHLNYSAWFADNFMLDLVGEYT